MISPPPGAGCTPFEALQTEFGSAGLVQAITSESGRPPPSVQRRVGWHSSYPYRSLFRPGQIRATPSPRAASTWTADE
jgi:hypothetical protein